MDIAWLLGTILGTLTGIAVIGMAIWILYDFYKDHIKPRLKKR